MIEVADKWKHYYFCSNVETTSTSADAAPAGDKTFERLYKSPTISSSAKLNTKSHQVNVTIESRTDPSDFSPSRSRSSSTILPPHSDSETAAKTFERLYKSPTISSSAKKNMKKKHDQVELTIDSSSFSSDFGPSRTLSIFRPPCSNSESSSTISTVNTFERLYKSPTFSSTQKQIFALPRSKSSSASLRTSRSCTELPATDHSSSNSTTGGPTSTLGPSSTTTMSSVFERLAQASTVTSKTKSELKLKYRDELSKKIIENKMRRNGDLRIDYGVISESQASDIYYRGIMSMTKMELQRVKKAIENNYQAETKKIDLDKLILYSKVLEKNEE